MADLFNLHIVTPDKIFFDGQAEEVILRTEAGEIGILAKHESYISVLPPGAMKIKIDGKFFIAAISQGLVKVSKEKTTVITNSVEWASEIDIDRAKSAEIRARQMMSQQLSDLEMDLAELKLKRALNRISVHSKYLEENKND